MDEKTRTEITSKINEHNRKLVSEYEKRENQFVMENYPISNAPYFYEGYEYDNYYSTNSDLFSFNNQHSLTDDFYISDMLDLLKIQWALFSIKNLKYTLEECAEIWETTSFNVQASWLFTPKEVKNIVMEIETDSYFEGFKAPKNA